MALRRVFCFRFRRKTRARALILFQVLVSSLAYPTRRNNERWYRPAGAGCELANRGGSAGFLKIVPSVDRVDFLARRSDLLAQLFVVGFGFLIGEKRFG